MRISKLIGALLMALAFSAVAVATASAAEVLWKWLPGSAKETFKGKAEKSTIQEKGGVSISCTKSLLLLTFTFKAGEGGVEKETTASSELLEEGSTSGKDATLALAIAHFEGCTAAGLPFKSAGDASGIVLIHYEVHNCLIKKGEYGLLFKPLPLTLEVPSTKLVIEIRGSFVALLEAEAGGAAKEGTKALTFKLGIAQKEGEQTIKLCEGGEKESLESNTDKTKFVLAGFEAKGSTLEFDMTKDTLGEEPMEK